MPDLSPLALYRLVHEIVRPLTIHSWPFVTAAIPSNGVYLIYEEGEFFEGAPRIVRVGSHPTQRGLPRRLRTHRSGSKNSSVFRKHLGSALMRKQRYPDEHITLWMRSKTRGWPHIEQAITAVLQQCFTFSCVHIEGAAERMQSERHLIASLTSLEDTPASQQWLGRLAWRPVIPACGMWNSQYVRDARVLDQHGLSRLEQLVEESLHHSATQDALTQ